MLDYPFYGGRMLKKELLLLTLFTLASTLHSGEQGIDFDTERVTLSHIESNGVGYSQGYSSLNGFLIRPASADVWVLPFIDLRGHIFNNGKQAANGGLGVRFLGSRIYGLYAYYDYRKTDKHTYHQACIGAESLGKIFDFRVNSYLPLGEDSSPYYDVYTYLYRGTPRISRSLQFSMEGFNAEIGIHSSNSWWDLYTVFGPYYFRGYGRHAVGGEARVVAKLSKYFSFQVSSSFDTLFDTILQGQISLNIPFGGAKIACKDQESFSSKKRLMLQRVTQTVDRNEIIVVTQKRQSY